MAISSANRLRTTLCLLAALVIAAVPTREPWADSGMLDAISQLEANTAIDIGPFEWQRPAGEPAVGSVLAYSGMVYDPHHNRMLVYGGGHSTTWTDAVYALDLTNFQWRSLYAPSPYEIYRPENMQDSFWKSSLGPGYPRPAGRHTYDLLVVPPDREELFVVRAGTAGSSATGPRGFKTYDTMMAGAWGVMDLRSHQWEMVPWINKDFGGFGGVAEYDPKSGRIIVLGVRHAFAVDVDTRQTEIIFGRPPVNAFSGTMVYSPDEDAMLGVSPKGHTWKLVLDREDLSASTMERIATSGDEPTYRGGFDWDSKNRIMGGGVRDGKFFAFDPGTNHWTVKRIRGAQPENMRGYAMQYAPELNVFIFIARGRTYAYRWE